MLFQHTKQKNKTNIPKTIFKVDRDVFEVLKRLELVENPLVTT
jgi:hypothetical protein